MANSSSAAETARREWPLIAALLVFLAFTGADQIVFRPAAARYAAVLQKSADMGLVVGPGTAPPMLSSQMMKLLGDNSLQPAAAEQQGASGALTSAMLEDLTQLAARRGMQVISTEQGSVTQLEGSVLVRAHLQLRCRYGEFLGFLDDLSRSGRLDSIERFSIADTGGGRQGLDLWLSRTILKQGTARR